MTATRTLGILLSAWELIGLTGRVRWIPPMTTVLRKHPILGAAAVGWVAVHLLGHTRLAIPPGHP